MASALGRWALVLLALILFGSPSPGLAFKRRPNGCDWIGGDFAEPGEVIFNTGCRPGVRRPVHHAASAGDRPPKLLDRLDARAPANYGASARKSIGAGIQQFQIVKGEVAYGLDGGARLWRFVLGGKDSINVAQSVQKFFVADSGSIFVLEKDGTLWRMANDGSGRTFLDHQVVDFQPVGDETYILDVDKKLWRLRADSKTRDPVDATVAAFQAIDASVALVLGADGALWRETGDFHTRTKIGQPIAAFRYLAEGDATFVLAPDHVLWRRQGTEAPKQVDHDVAAFHIMDAHVVYVLATDGRLWQEWDDRSHATLVDGDLAAPLSAEAFQLASASNVEGQAVYLLDRKHELWAETMPMARGGP